MSCVTINFRLLLPNWLRSKKRERKFEDEAENYIDLYWSFQPDYENQYDNVPEEKDEETSDNIYDDVPLESKSLPSTLERTAMFEDIHSFLSGHQSGQREGSDCSEENFSSTYLSGTKRRREEVEQLFQDYIFQDSSFDRQQGLSTKSFNRQGSIETFDQQGSIERFDRQELSTERFDQRGLSTERFDRQELSIERFDQKGRTERFDQLGLSTQRQRRPSSLV